MRGNQIKVSHECLGAGREEPDFGGGSTLRVGPERRERLEATLLPLAD